MKINREFEEQVKLFDNIKVRLEEFSELFGDALGSEPTLTPAPKTPKKSRRLRKTSLETPRATRQSPEQSSGSFGSLRQRSGSSVGSKRRSSGASGKSLGTPGSSKERAAATSQPTPGPSGRRSSGLGAYDSGEESDEGEIPVSIDDFAKIFLCCDWIMKMARSKIFPPEENIYLAELEARAERLHGFIKNLKDKLYPLDRIDGVRKDLPICRDEDRVALNKFAKDYYDLYLLPTIDVVKNSVEKMIRKEGGVRLCEAQWDFWKKNGLTVDSKEFIGALEDFLDFLKEEANFVLSVKGKGKKPVRIVMPPKKASTKKTTAKKTRKSASSKKTSKKAH